MLNADFALVLVKVNGESRRGGIAVGVGHRVVEGLEGILRHFRAFVQGVLVVGAVDVQGAVLAGDGPVVMDTDPCQAARAVGAVLYVDLPVQVQVVGASFSSAMRSTEVDSFPLW